MQKLADDFILYHGSYCEVRQPQLECQVAIADEFIQAMISGPIVD